MKNIWVCGRCRAINNGKQGRCYSCQVPRSVGEMPEAAAAMRTAASAGAVGVLATAARSGARYRPTWPIAVLLIPLIVAATALTIEWTGALSDLIAANERVLEDRATRASFVTISLQMLAAYAAALILWSTWIALVVSNVPALTGQWPQIGPIGAFLAPFIPFIGLKRPLSVVGGVLGILDEGRTGPRLIAFTWWVVVLATWFVPSIILFVIDSGPNRLQTLRSAAEARLYFLVPAAVLAIAVILVVEKEQRGALRRRAGVVLGVEGTRP